VIGDDPDEVFARERQDAMAEEAATASATSSLEASVPFQEPSGPDGHGLEVGVIIGDDPDDTFERERQEMTASSSRVPLHAGVVLGDDPDEMLAHERREVGASQAVPRPEQGGEAAVGEVRPSPVPQPRKERQRVVYTHSDGHEEVVELVKRHADSDGGGITVFIPSLKRERQTLESRIAFQHPALDATTSSSSAGASASAVATPALSVPVPASSDDQSSVAAAPTEPAASSRLPAGWSEQVDPTSGDKYYWHETTGETSWDPPLPPSWQEQKTETGDVYYWNSETNETTWDRPCTVPATPAPAAPAAAASASAAAASAPAAAAPGTAGGGQHHLVHDPRAAAAAAPIPGGYSAAAGYPPPGGNYPPYPLYPQQNYYPHHQYPHPHHPQQQFPPHPHHYQQQHQQQHQQQPGAAKPWEGLTGAARREAKRQARGLGGRGAASGRSGGAVADLMDVSHPEYSDEFQCLSEDQLRRQKVADSRAAASSSSSKALPSPGEVLRMNGNYAQPPPGAESTPAAAAREPRLDTVEDIMKLIAEEDRKAKTDRANAEWKEQNKELMHKRKAKKSADAGGAGDAGHADGSWRPPSKKKR